MEFAGASASSTQAAHSGHSQHEWLEHCRMDVERQAGFDSTMMPGPAAVLAQKVIA